MTTLTAPEPTDIEPDVTEEEPLGVVSPPEAQETENDLVRVLHVVNGEHFSGAERVQDLLALSLPDFGYEVGFATLKQGMFAGQRDSLDAPLHELGMRGKWDLTVALRLAKIAQEEGYSLLHAHTPRSLLVTFLACHWTKLPFVYHVHSPAGRDSTRWFANRVNAQIERAFARQAKQLITVSPTLTDYMRVLGFPTDNLRCVLNGVPCLPYDAPGARLRRRPVEPFVVGMVALFRPRKGAEVLLEAIAALRSRGHDVRLEAIGPFESEDYEAELHALASKLSLQEAVHWAGFTDDVPGALARVDALALPSLFGEGLPMVVLEAMAAGLPVVATRCEGTSEAILHRETGLLVEPGSVSQLTDALEEVFSGEIDYPEMSIAARERHADRFSAEAMAKQVAGVYSGVLKHAEG